MPYKYTWEGNGSTVIVEDGIGYEFAVKGKSHILEEERYLPNFKIEKVKEEKKKNKFKEGD